MKSKAKLKVVRSTKSKKKAVGKKVVAGRKDKIAVVVGMFNEDICSGLRDGALKALEENGYKKTGYQVFYVAGAFEIPLMCQKILKSKKYAGVVALGCVIRGDTPHFDYVCRAATDGCLQVQLTVEKPIAFGVLTTDNRDQALERSQPNDYNKGREATFALLDSLNAFQEI